MKFIFILIVFSYFSIACAEKLKVAVSAKHAILMNAETGAILYEKKSEDLAYPASLTKIATCLYAIKNYQNDLDTLINCPDHCLQRLSKPIKISHNYEDPPYLLEPDGSHYLIKKGEKLSFRELLYGLMIASGNDAANTLAHHVGGSISEFVEGMNRYVKKMGCQKTHFANPHGLHHPQHYSTAKDIALITREALQVPLICTIVATKEHERSQTNLQPPKTIENKNLLIQPGKFFYPQAVGMKTGYHSDAGYTYAGVAQYQDRTLIAVLLGCQGSYYQCFQDAICLFDAAFEEEKKERILFNKEDNLFYRRIRGGKQPLKAALTQNVTIAYYPAEEGELTIELNWQHKRPPIAKGSVVGRIQVLDQNGKEMQATSLVAQEDVCRTVSCALADLLFPEKIFCQNVRKRGLPFIAFGGLLIGALFFWIQRGKKSRKIDKG